MNPWVLLAVLAGCGDQPAPSPPVEQKAPSPSAPVMAVAPVQTVAPAVAPSSGEAEQVVLVWEGISSLHKSFFMDQAAVEQLGRDMAGLVKPPANVHIKFDSDRHIGRVEIKLLPGTGINLQGADSENVDLSAVSPLLQGLARYRSSVAARYDTRVEAFRIGIESYRGLTHCRFSPGGPLPPDGTVVSGCVEINGIQNCGEASDKGFRYPAEVMAQIQDCLR